MQSKVSCSSVFQNIYRHFIGLLGQGISLLQAVYLHRTTQTQQKCRHTSTPKWDQNSSS
jgi:hypothetical protein